MINVVIVVLYVGLPALALFLCNKFKFLNRIGAVVVSYVIGLFLGICGLSETPFHNVQEVLMSITVPLAIPLLLFSSNVKGWKKLAIQPFYALLFAILAVFIAVVSGYLLFGGAQIEGFNKVGGLLVGIYSGGTPNLASLKMILNVEEEVYLAVHSYDMAIGAVYLFFLMGVGQRLFQLVLPKYNMDNAPVSESFETEYLLVLLKSRFVCVKLMRAFALALIMVAVAGGIMVLVPKSVQMVVFIFLITALGIWGSSLKKMNSTKGTFDLGMYLILIFSIVVSSKVQLNSLSSLNPSLFA